jgi:hypothetical protein
MNVIDIHVNSLKYSIQDIKKVLIFGVMCLFMILIIPIFLVFGYMIRVIKNTTEHNDSLPDFDNAGSMFIDGVKYIALMIIAYIIFLLATFSMVILLSILIATLNEILAIIVMMVMALIAIPLSIVSIMVYYIAIVHMAHTGKFSAAFKFGDIIQRIKNIGWIHLILWNLTLIIIVMIIIIPFVIISMIPILGFIIYCLIGIPIMYLFMCRSMGLIYNKGNI